TVRRREILEASYNQILEKGIEGLTFKNIGKRMEVAPSLISHYFSSKDELMVSVVEYMLETMDTVYLDELEKLETAEERLNFFIEETINLYVAQSVADAVWYACFGLSMHHTRILEGFEKVYDRDLETSARLIKEYCDEKGLECDHPYTEAVKLISFVEGLNCLHAVYGDKKAFTQAINEYKHDFMAHLKNSKKQKPNKKVPDE
ncbi:MAG: TetR/AcrR family transcriptional regulator, partial [Spirochaetia bacterium]